MNSSHPQVTVLMPVFNASRYLKAAISSVLDQTYTDFEFLIVDDGSTDNSLNIIQQFSDVRMKIIHQENAGVAVALNNGLLQAEGTYICRFDADDICEPDRIEKQLNFLKQNPDYCIVGSDAKYILEDGEYLFNYRCPGHLHEEIVSKIYDHCPFIHSAVMYKKEVVINAGAYSPFAHNFEDYLLWVNLAKKGKMRNLSESLINVRFNPASVTIDEKWRSKRFRALKKSIILTGIITEQDGNELKVMIKTQDTRKIKEGSYHALCAKKFLVDNFQPTKARQHVCKAISIHPLRLDNYALLFISFLPALITRFIYKTMKRTNL